MVGCPLKTRAEPDVREWPIPDFPSVSRRKATSDRHGHDKYAFARDYYFAHPPPDIVNMEQAVRAWETMPLNEKRVWDQQGKDFLQLLIWGNKAFYTVAGDCLVESIAAAAITKIQRCWRRAKVVDLRSQGLSGGDDVLTGHFANLP